MKLTLQADDVDDLVLGESIDSPFGLRWHNLGSPAPREVTENAPGANGTIDSTALEGGRTVSAIVQLHPWTFAAEQTLKRFTRPDLRATLLIDQTDADPAAPVLQATVRGIPFDVDVDVSLHELGARQFVCQWSVPSGVLESAEESFFEVAASADATDGIDWPIDWPIDWGSPSSPGLIEVTNDGDRDAFPVLQLHGAWSDETRVQNLTTGRELVFDGLSVTDGNYLEVDMRAATVFLNGDPSQSRLDYRVFPESSFWALAPGVNVLRFLVETSSSPARMAGRYRAAYS